jgi:CubicO group peptidase (beta-lactamase class C family)
VRFLDRVVADRGSRVVGAAAIEGLEVTWTASAGCADDTLFQAGSLSKTVSAAVALELVERGELELDGAVAERLVSWHLPAGASGTTLRDLLGHTSGANVPFYAGYMQGSSVPTLAQSLGGIEPATTPAVDFDQAASGRFRYSGGGFAVVQQVIEDLIGLPFAEVAREVILDPMGMTRSTFLQPPPRPLNDSLARADWHYYPECAAAGLWSTPGDLARFVCALQAAAGGKPAVLSQRAAEAMTSPRVPLPTLGQWTATALLGLARPQSAGLGLFLRGLRFINLGGAAGSFSALTGSTEDGNGAVVMTAGCRPPLVLRVLFALADAQGWSGVRASRRGVRRRASDGLLRLLS